MQTITWRKSRQSMSNGACVEVARLKPKGNELNTTSHNRLKQLVAALPG